MLTTPPPSRPSPPTPPRAANLGAPLVRRGLLTSGAAAILLCALAAPVPSTATSQAASSTTTVAGSAHGALRPVAVTTSSAAHGLRATMIGGNTYGDQVREADPRADGYRHVDTPKLIAQLKAMNVNLYVFQIWDSPTDWQDLTQEFAPAAQAAGIQVWPYIVPPSECSYFDSAGNPLPRVQRGRCSLPYGRDYVGWADAVARLSVRYPVVTGWAIDDFTIGANSATFTPTYMQQIKDAQDAVNPALKLYTTAYLGSAVSETFLSKYAPYIAGVIYPYLGTRSNNVDASQVGTLVDEIYPHTHAHGLGLLLLAYANRFVGMSPKPRPEYIDDILQQARPRVASGELEGVINYGTPMDGTPTLNSDYLAHSGVGRLSLSVSGSSAAGGYASASKTIDLDPSATDYAVDFWNNDQWGPDPSMTAPLFGYHLKQLLVDGTVVWSSDVMDGQKNVWQHIHVDLTAMLAGKTQATLSFRLYEKRGVSTFPVDMTVDDVTGTGFAVPNGDFERTGGWQLDSNDGGVQPAIVSWSADQQQEIANVVASNYAKWAGAPQPSFTPVQTPPPANPRSMYGAGRLDLSVAPNAATTAGQCASATQTVPVQPSPRYEISFFVNDNWLSGYVGGYHRKQITIDGTLVYDQDAADYQHNDWLQGAGLQGPIDITDLVSGKSSVTISLRLCEARGVTDFPVDVGFDNLTTVGLPLQNPGFDSDGGWRLSSDGNVQAVLDE